MPTCEICEGNKFTQIATQIREGEGSILQCDKCGLVIQDIDWHADRLREYYDEEYQSSNSLITGEVQTPLEHFNDRLKTIQPLFEKIKPLLKKESRVLDVGCGAGELLSRLKPHVKYCAGVELHTSFVDFIRNHLEIDAFAGDLNKIHFDQPFDLVICICTLDHLPNPLQTLLTMKRWLSPGGKIYLEVPNREEALNYFLPEPNRIEFNKFFWHRAHLFYFTRKTIAALFQKAGLAIDITCRHEYTLKNFLNWYFRGEPQPSFVTGVNEIGLFDGKSDFEVRMNDMFDMMEGEFKAIMSKTFRGDSLCCLGWTASQ